MGTHVYFASICELLPIITIWLQVTQTPLGGHITDIPITDIPVTSVTAPRCRSSCHETVPPGRDTAGWLVEAAGGELFNGFCNHDIHTYGCDKPYTEANHRS